MAIARGRNNIQASIEDEAYLLICAATEINQYYKNKCIEILSRIEEIKKENMTENPEVISGILSSKYQILDWYEDIHNQTINMFVPKVYSYAEKHVIELLKRKSFTIQKARKIYRNEKGTTQGISDIQKGCFIICKCCDMPQDEIWSNWKNFDDFHSRRVALEHRFDTSKKDEINIEYILKNIENAKIFLSNLEKLSR